MKQLFFALAVALLLSACNNNKTPEMGGNMFGNNKGKSPWQNNNNNNNNVNNNGNNPGGGRWSPALRNAIMQGCLGEVGNDPQAKEKCDCWVGKVEARFPNAQTADQIPEEAANQLATECMQQFGGGNYVPPVNNDYGNEYNNNINDGGVTARTWPSAQRQQWIMGCAGNAQQTFGLNQQQATEYCDCITRKVEQKYTFAEAVRLTVQDFSTPEWESVRMNCQAALGY